MDSPIHSSSKYNTDTISLRYENYDPYNSIYSTEFEIGNWDKKLGHYKVYAFDQLSDTVKYFKVSETGLEIIPSESYLEIKNQYVKYGETLNFSGYADNPYYDEDGVIDYTYVHILTSQGYDMSQRAGDDINTMGNRAILVIDYETDEYKKIGNVITLEMNEIGYFEGQIPITRNMPNEQIITLTLKEINNDTVSEFVILGDEKCNQEKYFIHAGIIERANEMPDVESKLLLLLKAKMYQIEVLDKLEGCN